MASHQLRYSLSGPRGAPLFSTNSLATTTRFLLYGCRAFDHGQGGWLHLPPAATERPLSSLIDGAPGIYSHLLKTVRCADSRDRLRGAADWG